MNTIFIDGGIQLSLTEEYSSHTQKNTIVIYGEIRTVMSLKTYLHLFCTDFTHNCTVLGHICIDFGHIAQILRIFAQILRKFVDFAHICTHLTHFVNS